VAVSNPGPGIPRELLPRVFDRFFRADASRPDSARGSGLGLAIVKSIVELHGGGIEARSEPGALTTFRMIFPRGGTIET
jgi:two-component system heavy metal sensor histidine kinase CusS